MKRGTMEVRKILCACGSGVGCSLMLESNVQDWLKSQNKSDVEVLHATTSAVRPGDADLYVMSRDLSSFASSFPEESKVVLNDLVDADELNQKLTAAFAR